MSIIIIVIIWYFVIGRNNPKIYDKVNSLKTKKKKRPLWVTAILIVVALSVLSSISPWLYVFTMLIAPFVIFFLIVKAIINAVFYKKDRNERVANEKDIKVSGKTLVKAVPKRRKIVEKFNNKYGLNLTDSQITLMVDSSYMSIMWEEEIIAMSEEYNSMYEWFKSDTSWLRAYLRVFNVQDVSSDFEEQKNICFNAFDQIFAETDYSLFTSRKELISHINNMYMTNFDEVTFMIAYRFLKDNGKAYDIGLGSNVMRNEDEAEKLARKYS